MCLNKDTAIICFEYKRINAGLFLFTSKCNYLLKAAIVKLIKERKKIENQC